MKFNLNYRPDPEDERDYRFESFVEKVTAANALLSMKEAHIIESSVPVHHQGGLGSCVAHGVISGFQIVDTRPTGVSDSVMNALEGRPYRAFSRLFLYWVSRRRDGMEMLDDGTYVRSAFKSLKTTGLPLEDVWPYDESLFAKQPTLEAFEAGYDRRLTGFYRITTSGSKRLDDVEWAIRADHPVVFGTKVGQAFVEYAGENVVWHPTSRPIGGHCMCIDGVRTNDEGEREFRLRNSWGTGWGQGGFAWAAEDWIADPWSGDFWVPTMLP